MISAFGLVFSGFATEEAHAGRAKDGVGKFMGYFVPPKTMDYERRYMFDGYQPHNYLYNNDEWSAQEWLKQRSPQQLLDGFYQAGILTDQYEEDGIPAIEVGRTFMTLSSYDKVKVIKTLDAIYGVTEHHPAGTILVFYEEDDRDPVAVYSGNGVQFQ